MRWSSYYLSRGDQFISLWRALSQEPARRILLILGLGFDPRCLEGLKGMIRAGALPARCRAVQYGSGRPNSNRDLLTRAAANKQQLETLLDTDVVDGVEIRTVSDDERYVGGRRIVEAFKSPQLYCGFTDVVVDISALPPGLYFPLLGTLLQLSGRAFSNLHVIVSDNPTLDSSIVAEGGDRADMMVGFESGTDRVATANPLHVWAPVLGGQAHSQLRSIANHRDWTLIHPVLPFPSRNPRRGDELVASYHALLFDEWQTEPEDFIYADEQNPFDIYQALISLAVSVRTSLDSIGTPQILVSSHSSKLLSLGVLLAAVEERLGVVHVQPSNYFIDSNSSYASAGELYEIWLTGEPYAT